MGCAGVRPSPLAFRREAPPDASGQGEVGGPAREIAETERMAALLDAHLAKRQAGVVEKGIRFDPGSAERLRAMGYLR